MLIVLVRLLNNHIRKIRRTAMSHHQYREPTGRGRMGCSTQLTEWYADPNDMHCQQNRLFEHQYHNQHLPSPSSTMQQRRGNDQFPESVQINISRTVTYGNREQSLSQFRGNQSRKQVPSSSQFRGNQSRKQVEVPSSSQFRGNQSRGQVPTPSDCSYGRTNHTDEEQYLFLSKQLSYLLRHGAERHGYTLMKGGYLYVDDILWYQTNLWGYTEADVRHIVTMNNKQRFAIEQDPSNGRLKIRANQGHSLQIKNLDLTPITSKKACPTVIHGTYMEAWDIIKMKGLSRMGRNHIHFAAGEPGESGVVSGMRKSCEVMIFIDIEKALKDGLAFFRSANGVILSAGNEDGLLLPCYFEQAVQRKPHSVLPFNKKVTTKRPVEAEDADDHTNKKKKKNKEWEITAISDAKESRKVVSNLLKKGVPLVVDCIGRTKTDTDLDIDVLILVSGDIAYSYNIPLGDSRIIKDVAYIFSNKDIMKVFHGCAAISVALFRHFNIVLDKTQVFDTMAIHSELSSDERYISIVSNLTKMGFPHGISGDEGSKMFAKLPLCENTIDDVFKNAKIVTQAYQTMNSCYDDKMRKNIFAAEITKHFTKNEIRKAKRMKHDEEK